MAGRTVRMVRPPRGVLVVSGGDGDGRGFQLDGLGEQDVVFEVDVAVQVTLEVFEACVEPLVAGARVGGCVENSFSIPEPPSADRGFTGASGAAAGDTSIGI